MTTTEYRIYRQTKDDEWMESIHFDSQSAALTIGRLRDQNPDHRFRLERVELDHGPDEVTA